MGLDPATPDPVEALERQADGQYEIPRARQRERADQKALFACIDALDTLQTDDRTRVVRTLATYFGLVT